jgi:hypothetical protein
MKEYSLSFHTTFYRNLGVETLLPQSSDSLLGSPQTQLASILKNRNFNEQFRGTHYSFSCDYLLRLESDGGETDDRNSAKVSGYFGHASTK